MSRIGLLVASAALLVLSACGPVVADRTNEGTNPLRRDPSTSRLLNETPTTIDSNRGAPL
ncbi:hypothetical protein [Roseomonas indoligenes]|uniref:Argininosuccinate lyase n=1 Tax=Roseomonas indoligenes TaxID=2820811 RepID=A0A940S6Y9_9PROT|nr:hypothetical protein [Pararoseomonas indoligenes]MBP0492508.1 hypothetical protein [Pararoseomonas indoligenes]